MVLLPIEENYYIILCEWDDNILSEKLNFKDFIKTLQKNEE